MLRAYFVSFALIGIWIVAQIVVFQILRPARKFFWFTLLYLPTLAFFAILYWILPPSFSEPPTYSGFINGIFLYLLLYCTYGEFFFYIDRPLTLQMLIEFLKTPSGTLSAQELGQRYSMERMIHERLKSMVLNGYLRKAGDRFFLLPKGKGLAKIFTFIRTVLGVDYYLNAKEFKT